MSNTQKLASTQQADTQNHWRRLQTQLRRRRFRLFKRLLSLLPQSSSILDVGGTQDFWQKMQFCARDTAIVLYNLSPGEISYPGLVSMVGDARNMHEFADHAFDVVFSNSVIEHVGNYQQQWQMAQEVQRVGKRYYIQTPNRYFPIEPHVLIPLFQFLPFDVRVFILTHFRSPWGWKLPDRQAAIDYVREIRLLNERELRSLFPDARIYKEKFLGLTKSFIVYGGW